VADVIGPFETSLEVAEHTITRADIERPRRCSRPQCELCKSYGGADHEGIERWLHRLLECLPGVTIGAWDRRVLVSIARGGEALVVVGLLQRLRAAVRDQILLELLDIESGPVQRFEPADCERARPDALARPGRASNPSGARERIGGTCPGCGGRNVSAATECECWGCADCACEFECSEHRPERARRAAPSSSSPSSSSPSSSSPSSSSPSSSSPSSVPPGCQRPASPPPRVAVCDCGEPLATCPVCRLESCLVCDHDLPPESKPHEARCGVCQTDTALAWPWELG
jgi:hypothetical protein